MLWTTPGLSTKKLSYESPPTPLFYSSKPYLFLINYCPKDGGNFSGYDNKIRLIGSFYKGKGISRDYVQQTSQYPEEGRVFRYTDIEIVKPYTIWDYTTEEPTTKTIEKGTKTTFKK